MKNETVKVTITIYQWDKSNENKEQWVELSGKKLTLNQLAEKMKEFSTVGTTKAVTKFIHPVTEIVHLRIMVMDTPYNYQLWQSARDISERKTS